MRSQSFEKSYYFYFQHVGQKLDEYFFAQHP
jgi:hypothetical protein